MIEYKQNGSNIIAVIHSGHICDCAVEIINHMSNMWLDDCLSTLEYCDTEFNKIPLRIYRDSNPRDVALIYNLKNEIQRAGK
jgi:hypothetical protein